MQDMDSELVSNQRKRRKRIGRIRNGIIFGVIGWFILSLVLIICLFVKVNSMQKQIETLKEQTAEEQTKELPQESLQDSETEVQETEKGALTFQIYDRVTPPATGIEEADNLATEGDTHKVYLTFDNGPSENTALILDTLAQYGIKATFFVSGDESEEAAALYQRIEDYHKIQDYLEQVTGVKSQVYRFPGGSDNAISNVPMEALIHFLNKEGTTYYDWNVSAGDTASMEYTAQEIVENVTQGVVKYKTSVVLLHDGTDAETTVEAIGSLIEALQGMGAEILPIDENTQVIQSVKAAAVE